MFSTFIFNQKNFFFIDTYIFFVLPKTEGSAETGSLTFSGAIIDVKSINIITDIYRIMFISNSIPVVAVWKIKMKTRSNVCLWSFSLNQFHENFRVTDFTENFVRGSYLPSVFLPGKLPPPPLSGSSQLEFSSKTSQSGSLDDDVLVRSFSVSWDVDISDRRQLTPLGVNEDL